MKNITLLFILLLSSSFLIAQDKEEVTVSSAIEFVEALKSNRIIIIDVEWIYVSDLPAGMNTNYYTNENPYRNLMLKGLYNITIKSKDERPVKIITHESNSTVLVFDNCSNIKLDNLELGHGYQKGNGCSAGVLGLHKCKNVTIENCTLFGSGTFGLATSESEKITLQNSTIRSCTEQALQIHRTNDFTVKSCNIYDNIINRSLLEFNNCINVNITDSNIYLNNVKENRDRAPGYRRSILASNGCMNTTVSNCKIDCNLSEYFFSKQDAFELKNTDIGKNTFIHGSYPD